MQDIYLSIFFIYLFQATIRYKSIWAQDYSLFCECETSESADRLGHVGQQGHSLFLTAVLERLPYGDNTTKSAELRITRIQEIPHLIAEVKSDLS